MPRIRIWSTLELEASPVEVNNCRKDKKRRKRKGQQKFKKMQDIHVVTFSSKFGFVHIPRQKRLKMWCQWKERHSFVLQMPFWVDWSSLSSCYADGWNILIRYSFQSLKWAFKSVNLCNWKRNQFFLLADLSGHHIGVQKWCTSMTDPYLAL